LALRCCTGTTWRDILALSAFRHKRGGVALEMGALDGVSGSETLGLARAAGFRRILIEIDPGYRAARRSRAPNAVGVTAACCAADGAEQHRTMHFLQDRKMSSGVQGVAELMPREHLDKWYPGVASMHGDASANWSAIDWGRLPRGLTVTRVPCAPLPRLLHALGLQWVDVAVIDTEGAELSILQSVDFDAIGFGLLVVEAYSRGGSRPGTFAQDVIDLVHSRSRGQYEVFHRRHEEDIWLVHRSLNVSAAEVDGQLCKSSTNVCQRQHNARRNDVQLQGPPLPPSPPNHPPCQSRGCRRFQEERRYREQDRLKRLREAEWRLRSRSAAEDAQTSDEVAAAEEELRKANERLSLLRASRMRRGHTQSDIDA
jgi:hypothetical protein